MTTVRGLGGDRAAHLVTQATTPALVNFVVSLAIGLIAGDLAAGFAVGLTSGPVPFLYILLGVRRTRFSDIHVPVREQRPKLIAAILSGLTATLVVLVIVGSNRDVIALCAAMLATLVVIGLVTTVVRWKVSVHTAVLAGSVAMLAIAASPTWLVALVAVPVVGWSRVHLGAHTAGQVTTGGALGLIVAGATFLFVR